jgi:pyruvate-formate lyase
MPPVLRKTRINVQKTGAASPAPVDVYQHRPVAADELTMYQYFWRTRRRPTPIAAVPNDCTYIQQDKFKQHVYLLNTSEPDVIVRFDVFHPGTQTEAYCYDLLLQRVAFREENQLLTYGRTSYIAQCNSLGVMTDEAAMTQALGQHAQYTMCGDVDNSTHVHNMLQHLETVLRHNG